MKNYKALLKKFLSQYAGALRRSRGLTQEEMAELLRITSRAYSDLERGKHCFSAHTLLFLLLMLGEEERKDFLDRLQGQILAPEENNAA